MKKVFGLFKNPIVFRTFLIVLVVALSMGGYLYYEKRRDRIFIDDSMVSTPIISLVPTNPGKLFETDVYEGEQVKKGAPIAVVGSQTLYADTDGMIIMANNQTGGMVNSQSPVAQMIDLSDMRIAGTLDENKGLNQISVGQVVSFTVDALPGKTYWGYVDEISPSAKQTELSFSISSERPTQQFVVYARFDSSKYPEIKNGMSAKMMVFTKTK